MSDAINPDHYKRLPAEAIEIIESAIDGAPSKQGAYLHGQVLKYILRCWNKNGIEDLKKAKWYLDRLIGSLESDEQQKASDLQSHKEHPFGKLKESTLNSDTIPEGYRKLNDSREEPRQHGDLRWSIAEKRYIEISGDEIGYANLNNWAACRKVEPVIKQSLTPAPPDGFRRLELGEVMRNGDTDRSIEPIPKDWIGSVCRHKNNVLRRNRFEAGERVVDCRTGAVSTVQHTDKQYPIVFVDGSFKGIESKHLAPYIEVTGEVKPPDGWRFLEVGEVIRKGDFPFENGQTRSLGLLMIGQTCQTHWKPIIRRNRFEVGEKVVRVSNGVVYKVVRILSMGYLLESEFCSEVILHGKDIAPYIEETK